MSKIVDLLMCVSQVMCVPACNLRKLLLFCDTSETKVKKENKPNISVSVIAASVFGLCTFLYLGSKIVECRKRTSSVIGNDWTSKYISFCVAYTNQPCYATCTIRSMFMSTPGVSNNSAHNHTHAESARKRNDASSFMDLFSLRTGKRSYFLQMSAADRRHGRAGCRTFHWTKDLSVEYTPFNPAPDDMLCMVDVDYYLNMNQLLSESFQPTLLSTFQPSGVAKSTGDYTYTFNQDDEVTYRVSGGAEYNHKIWDYGTDVVCVKTLKYGFIHQYNIYNVDRKQLDVDHQLILLTPIKRIMSPFFDLSEVLGITNIKRLSVAEPLTIINENGKSTTTWFTRLNIIDSNGVKRSTGKCGTYMNATIDALQDDALAGLAIVGKKTELTPATIKTVVDVDQSEATMLTEYHRYKTGKTTSCVYPVSESIFKFQYNPKYYDADATPSLQAFMSPIALGCYAPDKCYNNDKAAIDGRVIGVKPGPEIVVTPKHTMYIKEFIEFLVPIPNMAHPVDFETVYEKQARPAQRMILDRASLVASATVDAGISSFQKSEAYGKITDPRIISTVPGVNKYNYSRYVYSFTDIMRQTAWYAFAKSPLSIATRVAEICVAAKRVSLTDLSRFDGRVSIVLRTLEHASMLRYFKQQYHRELNELMASQKNQRARTTYGVKYDTGDSRASGSAETADFNSMDNAFMAYGTLREQGLSPKEAWGALGVYGGDDGVSPDIDTKLYVNFCASVGQVLEIFEIKRGEAGVSFLAREYGPEVWHGAKDSMCDVPRQLTKLHTTISLPSNVTPLRKLGEKMLAYYLTDANTPIIGAFATMIATHFRDLFPTKLGEDHVLGVANYAALHVSEEQYPNEDSANGWMLERVKATMPDFDFDQFDNWLSSVSWATYEPELLLAPPLCGSASHTHVSKIEIVVNGEIVKPLEKPQKVTRPSKKEYTAEQLEYMHNQPCREFLSAKGCKFAKCRFKH